MNILGYACFRYLEKKGKLFTRKFLNIMSYTEFYKNTLRHVKTTTLYLHFKLQQHSETCAPLGDIFLAIEIECIAMIISKEYFVLSN